MCAELALVLGEVAVHVEHAGIGVAEKAHAAAAQRAQNAGGLGPLLDLFPCAAGRLLAALLLGQHAGDDMEVDVAAVEDRTELGNAAGAAVGQPLFGIGIGVVKRGRGLEIEDEHRHFGNLDGWQDHRAGGIGADVAVDHVDLLALEEVAGGNAFRRRIDQAGADDIGPLADAALHAGLVAFELFFQAGKLRPILAEADTENTNSGTNLIPLVAHLQFLFVLHLPLAAGVLRVCLAHEVFNRADGGAHRGLSAL